MIGKSFETRVVRGRMLKILDLDYPNEMGDEVIVEALRQAEMIVSKAVVAGHLEYLHEKGYADVRDVTSRDLGLSMKMARLTAKGKDLLEGSIDPDVGVVL